MPTKQLQHTLVGPLQRTISRFLALAAMVMGLAVIYGWHTRNTLLVQIRPDFVPMQYNTALGFVLGGLGLLFLIQHFRKIAAILGCGVLALGTLTLSQYVAGWNLGIDELFMDHYTEVKTSHRGRMAPNTALGYILVGLMLIGLSGRRSWAHVVGLSSSILAFVVGLFAFFGYILGVENSYGWGQLTRMAFHTAIGFILLGTGGAISFWQAKSNRDIFPILCGMLVACSGLFIWALLEAGQQNDAKKILQARADRAANVMRENLDQTTLALGRMAERLDAQPDMTSAIWRADAIAYFNDFPALQRIGWIDAEKNIIQQMHAPGCDPCDQSITLDLERSYTTPSAPMKVLIPDERINTLVFLFHLHNQESQARNLLAELALEQVSALILGKELKELQHRVQGTHGMVHQQGEPGKLQASASFAVQDHAFVVTVYSDDAFLSAQIRNTPAMLLFGSALLAALLAISLALGEAQRRLSSKLTEYTTQLEIEARERAALNASLERRTRQLERSNQELEDFAYVASHDLKEPLRGIRSYAKFLMEDFGEKLGDEGASMLKNMAGLSDRLQRLIDDLLLYSRIGRAQEQNREVCLDDIVDEVLDSIRTQIEAECVEIRRPRTLPTIRCDRSRIAGIFYNLITNAIKYNDSDRKWVQITCDDGNPVQFEVSDNGIGIEESFQGKIFGMFSRLHHRDEYGGGTGVGLAIVKKTIDTLGGKIWITSTPGDGTTFHFTLG